MDKLKWCKEIKDGLRETEPNERLSKSYLKEAKATIERAEKIFRDDDLLWTTVMIYYAEYYALYSLLQRIGYKCENHFCSILAVTMIVGKDKTETINNHKNKRIDAQYYMRTGKKEEVDQMLREAKIFIAEFDNHLSRLDEKEIKNYRDRLK